jgi:putative nucleotidyltransferase with HDIG domain
VLEEACTPPPADLPEHGSLAQDLVVARAVRDEAMTTVASIFEGVRTGTPIPGAAVKHVVGTLIDSLLRRHDALMSLIHTRRFEANLFQHAINVCVLALVIGERQRLDRQQLESLGIGALLHDVGELRLPQNLLRKSGVYTEAERRLMQQHPRLGAVILAQSDDIPEVARRIVAEHHERLDGSGYPLGLQGNDICPLSQIVGIADVYDAMFSTRGWRPPLSPVQAVKELYQYGHTGQFDLGLVETAIRCLGIYPVGSVVELSTGERGVVVGVNPADALRPVVQVIWDAARQPYPTPLVVHLSAAGTETPARTIRRVLDAAKEQLDVASYLEESD